MSYILTYVRVALATTDVHSILEIPATDEIHMEDRNHGLAWAIFKMGNGNGERGSGNGERGTGNGESLKWGIFKSGNL